MLLVSFRKLLPTSELPANTAGIITTTDSYEDVSQPLLAAH